MDRADRLKLYSVPLSSSLRSQGTARKDHPAIVDGPSGENT